MDELLAVVPPIFWLAAQKSNPPRHTFNLSLRNQCIVAEKWKKKATVEIENYPPTMSLCINLFIRFRKESESKNGKLRRKRLSVCRSLFMQLPSYEQ